MPFFVPDSAALAQEEVSLAGGQVTAEQANLVLRKHQWVWDSLTPFSQVSSTCTWVRWKS